MNFHNIKPEYKIPIICYLGVVAVIFVLRLFLGWDLVFSLSAAIMLVVPILVKKDSDFFYFSTPGFIKGLVISILVLIAYVLVLFGYSRFSGGQLSIKEFGVGFLLLQFFLVAIPEEVFFRGYLQKEFGNNYRAIVIVSVLFAIAHLVVVCAVSGGINLCSQNALTFFPSLVMGYLFMKTGTIWSSVAFHFLANVVHIVIYVT